MKKIVLFSGYIPDIIKTFMEEHNFDEYSPELRCHPDLIKMVENARVVSFKDVMDNITDEFKRTGELYRSNYDGTNIYHGRRVYSVQGYSSNCEDFVSVCVCTYDETHRHFFSELNGHEFLFDLDELMHSPYLPTGHNLWECTGRVENSAPLRARQKEVMPVNNFVADHDWRMANYLGEKEFTIPDGAVEIGAHAIQNCENLISIKIPDSVTKIGSNAFSDCRNLRSITIPNSVTSIEDDTFKWCTALEAVTIPDSIIAIGKRAFAHCKNLTSVTIPNSVKEIGDNAFYNSPVTIICDPGSYAEQYARENEIPTTHTQIPQEQRRPHTIMENFVVDRLWVRANYHGEKDFTIPDGTTELDEHAFADIKSLTSVKIPNSVKTIGVLAFEGCVNLKSVAIPESVTSIGEYAFGYCDNLTSATIANGVTEIKPYAFYGSALERIEIPNSVTCIGEKAFGNCPVTIVCDPNSYVAEYARKNDIACKWKRAVTPTAPSTVSEKLAESCAFVLHHVPFLDPVRNFGHRPKIALILGSGLGSFADRIDVKATLDYAEIPGFPVSTVAGHAGRFVFGYCDGVPVVAMQGRVHMYEGYTPQEAVMPIRLLKLLGIRVLVLTNAAGGIQQGGQAGDLMLITDHISSFVPSPLRGQNLDELGVRFPDMSEVYSKRLNQIIRDAAASEDIPLKEGVYLQTPGPQYETPAEIRMFRALGADAVGMSTAIEAIAARHCGMEVCGISCITNLAAGISPHPLSHEEVKAAGEKVAPQFEKLIRHTIAGINTVI